VILSVFTAGSPAARTLWCADVYFRKRSRKGQKSVCPYDIDGINGSEPLIPRLKNTAPGAALSQLLRAYRSEAVV